MMPKFEVEFLRTSYITHTVEADSAKEAEKAAWSEIPQHEFKNANWSLESVTQTKERNHVDN